MLIYTWQSPPRNLKSEASRCHAMGFKADYKKWSQANHNISRLQNVQSLNDFCKHQGKALDRNDKAPMVVAYGTMAGQGNENHD